MATSCLSATAFITDWFSFGASSNSDEFNAASQLPNDWGVASFGNEAYVTGQCSANASYYGYWANSQGFAIEHVCRPKIHLTVQQTYSAGITIRIPFVYEVVGSIAGETSVGIMKEMPAGISTANSKVEQTLPQTRRHGLQIPILTRLISGFASGEYGPEERSVTTQVLYMNRTIRNAQFNNDGTYTQSVAGPMLPLTRGTTIAAIFPGSALLHATSSASGKSRIELQPGVSVVTAKHIKPSPGARKPFNESREFSTSYYNSQNELLLTTCSSSEFENDAIAIAEDDLVGIDSVLISSIGMLDRRIFIGPNSALPEEIDLWFGDVNDDNVINTDDYLAFSDNFDRSDADPGWYAKNAAGVSPADCDFDGDGFVSTDDYDELSLGFDQLGDD